MVIIRGGVTTLPDSPPASSSQTSETQPSKVTLQLSGFEESVASLGLHGKDSGLTFNVMASPSNGSAGNQKGQEKILIYSKTLTVADIMSKPYAYKAGSEEPLALPLPEGSSNVEVEVVGLQSGIKSSETMVVDSADTNPLIANLDATPLMFPLDADDSGVNISLIMPVVEDLPKENQDGNQKSRLDKAEQTKGDENGRMGLFSIDPETGALYQLNSVQMGEGGNGSIGTFSNDGGLGFLFKKGQEGEGESKTFIRNADGSMKPVNLPLGTDETTVARDSETGNIYLLNSQEEALIVQQILSDGTLKEIQRVATGVQPSAIFLLQSSRLVLVVNQGANTLSSFSIATNGTLTALQTIATGPKPLAVAAGPQEKFVYVSNDDSTISRFVLGLDNNLTLAETTPTTHKLASLQFDASGGILTGLRFSPAMEDLQSGSGPQRMKSKFSKWWKKNKKAVISIALTVVIAVVIGYVNPIAGVASAYAGYSVCKDAWSRGQFCIYGGGAPPPPPCDSSRPPDQKICKQKTAFLSSGYKHAKGSVWSQGGDTLYTQGYYAVALL